MGAVVAAVVLPIEIFRFNEMSQKFIISHGETDKQRQQLQQQPER